MVGSHLRSMLYSPTEFPSMHLPHPISFIYPGTQKHSHLSQKWPAASLLLASCQSVYWHLLRRSAAEGRAWGSATPAYIVFRCSFADSRF